MMIKREFHITEKQFNNLEKEKKETGISKAEIVRRALDQYFDNDKNRGNNTNDNNKQ